MNETLIDLSEKIDKPVRDILGYIASAASSIGCPFFVVGATALDIILSYGYDISNNRSTQDIDFGIQVPDWDSFEQLKQKLIETGNFERDITQVQRLSFRRNIPIDVIPFGEIANRDQLISWPPNHNIQMSTIGFKEAYQNSINIKLREKPALYVKFASLPGLALLKIFAWDDIPDRNKDAKDLALIIRKYLDAGNEERLFEEAIELVDKDYDYETAGARLLGRDIAKFLKFETTNAILEILDRETSRKSNYKLARDMIDKRGFFEDIDASIETNLNLIKELKYGILDISS